MYFTLQIKCTETYSYFIFITALKIHCSSQFKAILDKLGGYTLSERGYVSMKVSRGALKTLIDCFLDGISLS